MSLVTLVLLCSWCYKCWKGSEKDSSSYYSSSSESLTGIPTPKYRASARYSSLQNISPPYTPPTEARKDGSGATAKSLKFSPPPPQVFEFRAQQPGLSDVVIPPEPPLLDATSKEQLGKLYFSLSYDSQYMVLTVKILKATGLPAKDFSGTSDPFVKIILLPDKKHKLETRVKRKNLNPTWNEVFTFEGFPHNKLLSRTLYLQVLDYDRFSRNDPIGEIEIPLSDVDLGPMVLTFCKELQPCKRAQVKIFVSLFIYLPRTYYKLKDYHLSRSRSLSLKYMYKLTVSTSLFDTQFSEVKITPLINPRKLAAKNKIKIKYSLIPEGYESHSFFN